MVTVLPKEDDWGETGRQIGQAAVQGYTERSDEKALQKALAGLGPNASARDILNAVTNTKTYSKEAKQTALKNYLGVAEFEELQRKNRAAEESAKSGKSQKEAELDEKKRANLIKEKQNERVLDISQEKGQRTGKVENTAGAIRSGLQTVQEMNDIGAKGNLGWGTGVRKVWSAEAAKDAAQYERLGKSLIQLSTSIIPRNRLEFEVLAHDLYDPSVRDAAREGILTAMKNLLTRNLLEVEGGAANEAAEKPMTSAQGKVRVRDKTTGKTGSVTPYEGMDAKYDRL
jgi:hypothetical protein